jgi:hypothetical protein
MIHCGQQKQSGSYPESCGLRIDLVPEYKAYTVGHEGHITAFEPLVCTDDAEAINEAKRLLDGHDIELWSGARLVIKLPSLSRQNQQPNAD